MLAVLAVLLVVLLRRRTWTVRAAADRGAYGHLWKVRSWRASAAVIDKAADALQTGALLPARGRPFGIRPEDLSPLWRSEQEITQTD
ncbi:MAG TPA: hypothetical protein VF549_07870 [Solirubrobacteraceae bacterium]